jgi:hypothetical protein
MIHMHHNTMTLYSLATNYASVTINLHIDMCMLLCIACNHHVARNHKIASS